MNPSHNNSASPYSLELEQVVLGALIFEPKAYDRIENILKPQHFSDARHVLIFSVMQELWSHGKSWNQLILKNQLNKKGLLEQAGNATYIVELTNRVVGSGNLEQHAALVKEEYIRQSLGMRYQFLAQKCSQPEADPFEILSEAEAINQEIQEEIDLKVGRDLTTIGLETIEVIEKITTTAQVLGISSGYPELDQLIQGWQKTDLIILAARPSMGKTAFALQLAVNAIFIDKKKVGIITLEMSDTKLMQRMTSNLAKINLTSPSPEQKTHYDRVLKGVNTLMQSKKLEIVDPGGADLPRLIALCRRLVKQKGCEMIIIDYLGLISPNPRLTTPTQQMAEISRALKLRVCKDLNIPVIALHQLNRGVENRDNKRPFMADLRDSGNLEQDADQIIMLYREDYYDKPSHGAHQASEGKIEVIVRKNRNGPTGTAILYTDLSTGRFFSDPYKVPSSF